MQKQNKKKNKRNLLILCAITLIMLIGIISIFCFPKVYINGNKNITINLGEEYNDLGAKAIESNKDISNKIKIEGDVNINKIGTYKIEYKIKKYGLTFSKVRYVEVIDHIYPIITLKGNSEVTLCPKKEFEEIGYEATDNYDGDITDKVKITQSEDSIVYSVTDQSGNKTEQVRKIIRDDKISPEIKLKGSQNIYLKINTKYEEPGYEAMDNCDDNLTNQVKITDNINSAKEGSYQVKYTVSDQSNNQTTVIRNIYVGEKENQVDIGVIYLTFDDGPSKSITPKILDILKEKNVKATFFVINHNNSLNYLIKRAYDEGHTVGLHSYSHDYKQIYSSTINYFEDLNKISNKVESITGEKTNIIRFPGGTSNTISKKYSKGIMTTLTQQVTSRGYRYYDWNVGSGDSGEATTKEDVYNNVVKNLSKKRLNMVLMHDFENNYKTLNALSDIIDYGLKNGYEFKAINNTTPNVTHKPNN